MKRQVNRRHGWLCLLFAISFLTVAIIPTESPTQSANLTIGNFVKLSEKRITRTIYEYTYRADITNAGPDLLNVTASATSDSINTTIVSNTLTFGNVSAGATVTSSNTFTFRQDRLYPFSWSNLTWNYSYDLLQNLPPVADAGRDQDVTVGALVTLDGRKSDDPDHNLITYKWAITERPQGSTASLDNPASVMPTFIPDQPGTYRISLVVNDGQVDSSPDEIVIVAARANVAPTANAGPGQSVITGTVVNLDGSASFDPDGDPITYHWQMLSRPVGSGASLRNADSVAPYFLADVDGQYVLQLIVNDGKLYSMPADVSVVSATPNSPPVASAGDDQTVARNTTIQLDGQGSSDPNNDPLTFIWTIVSKPDGSTSELDDPASSMPKILADRAGDYVFKLIVFDGELSSNADTVVVTAQATVPDVIGQPQASAEAAIIAALLTVGPIAQANSSVIPAGSVISQNPAGGTPVLAGATVSLVVSLGPAMVSVPDITGSAQASAETAILAAKLVVGTITTANSPTVPTGSVISQNPLAGSVVTEGSVVSFVVSSGPLMVTVPNVVGMTQSVAQSAVVAAGLYAGVVTSDYSNTIPPGSVISQNPAAGSSAAQGSPVNLVISLGPAGIPPDPASLAPPLDRTVSTTMSESTSFLYSGGTPIQTGVAPGTIDSKRAAVLRGKVLDRDNNPLYGVVITILNHPEYGQTISRLDGMFDMAVNGGGPLTIQYRKNGYINAQRQLNVPWKDYIWAPDLVLIPLDNQVTRLDLTASTPIQVARGGVVTDSDGSRQATVLVGQGTQAQMVMADGTKQPITTLNIRATEYTVGQNGPKAMPGELPPTSGYTYAVELSADEAISAGASTVVFSKPLYFYVEDFIGFPVGSAVPAGYYDRAQGRWIASENGRVIKIVGISGGLADVDSNGDGIADGSLGMTDEERRTLASLYSAGQQLWRVPITHFTPWDCNWPYGPPMDAESPNQPAPPPPNPDKTCEKYGSSSIECQNQVLGERVTITGSPFALNYRSDRQSGSLSSRTLTIPLSGPSVPGSLKSIILEIEIAGRLFTQEFAPAPNLTTGFTWDGLDAYARPVQGSQPIIYRIKYNYPVNYYPVRADFDRSFARLSPTTDLALSRGKTTTTLSQTRQGYIPALDFKMLGLGGWTMDVHHFYSVSEKKLYLGDGGRRSGSGGINSIISTVAGNGSNSHSGNGGPASTAALVPQGVAIGPDGTVYIADGYGNEVRKVGPDGNITVVAGKGPYQNGFSGDGGPANEAKLWAPLDVALGPDGSIYVNDYMNRRIRRIGLDGIITTVAGNGSGGYSGDGGPATQASFGSSWSSGGIDGLAVGSDGSIYISDTSNNRIRRVGPDGIVNTVAGGAATLNLGDNIPATQAYLMGPTSVAAGPDGSIYFGDMGRIRRVGPNGILTTVAGVCVTTLCEDYGYSGDGGPATQALLYSPRGIALGPDGTIYFADSNNHRIRKVGTDGIIATVAGNGLAGFSGDGGPAALAMLNFPYRVAVAPDGCIYVTDLFNYRVRKVDNSLPEFFSIDEIAIPSEDSRELYVFSTWGTHKRTVNALTGEIIYQFAYDSKNLLSTITDGSGNVTTIERDSSGKPTAIVGPFGQRTTLSVNADGYLDRITNPANEAFAFAYTNGGLLTSTTDPRNSTSNYQYDSIGSLVRAEDPAGGSQTLARTTSTDAFEVARTTALGRTTAYRVERLTTGGQRMLNTFPGGTFAETIFGTDGSTTSTYADGTVMSAQQGPDPRFGMQAPVTTSSTITTPGGLSSSITRTLAATLSDLNDPFSLTSLTSVASVNGRVYTNTFDTATNKITMTSPQGRRQFAVIDGQGRILSSSLDPALLPQEITYTPRGLPAQVSWGSQTNSFRYDSLGRPVAVTDAAGRVQGFEYDTGDRVNRLILPSGKAYGFSYDQNGNLTQVMMPSGASHALNFTKVNLDSSYAPPGSTPYRWFYDADRSLVRMSLPSGRTLDASYDIGGRPTAWTYPEAHVEYAYAPGDNTSRVHRIVRTPLAQGMAQENSFTYDGPLVNGLSFSGASNGQFSYTYDNNFFLTNVSLVSGTDSVQIGMMRDTDGLTIQHGPFMWKREGPAGAVSSITDGTLDIVIAYDSVGRIASRTHKMNGVAVYQIQTTFDNTGRISQNVESIGGISRTMTYSYDVDGQLMNVAQDGTTIETYGYDVNGNRTLRQAGPSLPVTAVYDNQDRLVKQGNVDNFHDSDGYLIQRGSDTFSYSTRGELLQAIVGGRTVSYMHDGWGRRVARTDTSGTTQYLYGNLSRPFQLTASREQSGQLTIYYYAQDKLFALNRGGTLYYVATDQVGTPRVVTDVTGAIIKVIKNDSYGNVLSDSNAGFLLQVGFAGGLHDPDTGIVRFGYRDYDPSAGRWMARDPILFRSAQMNLYSYVGNDPISFLDPTGLELVGGVCMGACTLPAGTITVYSPKGESQMPGGIADAWVNAGTNFNGTFEFGNPAGHQESPECSSSPSANPSQTAQNKASEKKGTDWNRVWEAMKRKWNSPKGEKFRALMLGVGAVWAQFYVEPPWWDEVGNSVTGGRG